jgi:hypothetical protein
MPGIVPIKATDMPLPEIRNNKTPFHDEGLSSHWLRCGYTKTPFQRDLFNLRHLLTSYSLHTSLTLLSCSVSLSLLVTSADILNWSFISSEVIPTLPYSKPTVSKITSGSTSPYLPLSLHRHSLRYLLLTHVSILTPLVSLVMLFC